MTVLQLIENKGFFLIMICGGTLGTHTARPPDHTKNANL